MAKPIPRDPPVMTVCLIVTYAFNNAEENDDFQRS
jgi:hypothetical protein